MFQWWRDRKYVRVKRGAIVRTVQTGYIELDERPGGGPSNRKYQNLSKTFVQPGQILKPGAVIGKR